MDFTKEVWHCELYKLQQQSPVPVVIKCCRKLDKRPLQYGEEYHGNIDRIETERILSNFGTGAFLIRDSQRNAGAFTLAIRFDCSNRNYVLYYNTQTRQHYVGSKYFDNIIDLVHDGLIHMYIESRGADILRKIAEAQVYEATPYYRSKCIQQEKMQQKEHDQKQRITKLNQHHHQQQHQHQVLRPIQDYNGSCDSGIFNSLRSSEPGILDDIKDDDEADDDDCTFIDEDEFSSRSSQMSIKTKSFDSEIPPLAPPRRKSLYSSNNHYEPIFETSRPNNMVVANNLVSTLNDKLSVNNTNFHLMEKSHSFRQHTFVGPQWCDFCAHFMWGLVLQGIRCQDCGFQAHRKCGQKIPADCCPKMDRLRRLFGVELTGLAKMNRRAVPQLFSRLIEALEFRGLTSDGLYRISGNLEVIEELRNELDKDIDSVDLINDTRLQEIDNLTGLIKLFLRQLPIPLIGSDIYTQLLAIIKQTDYKPGIREAKVRESLALMHSVYFATLEYFICHLHRVSKLNQQNRMTSGNLAIVFSPTLISKPSTTSTLGSNHSTDQLMNMLQSDHKWDCAIIQNLIDNYDHYFTMGTTNSTTSLLDT